MAEAQGGSTLRAFTQHKPSWPWWAPGGSPELWAPQWPGKKWDSRLAPSSRPDPSRVSLHPYTQEPNPVALGYLWELETLHLVPARLTTDQQWGLKLLCLTESAKLLWFNHKVGVCSEHETDPSSQHIYWLCHKKLAKVYTEKIEDGWND